MCDDPTDISLWILKVLGKCLGGEMAGFMYLMRAGFGLALDYAETIILAVDILDVFAEDDTTIKIVTLSIMGVMFISSISLIGWLYGGVIQDGIDEDTRQRRFNRFFIVFKTVNVVFAAILTAGAVYGWEELDIQNLLKDPIDGAKVFFVVSLGLDVLFDPFELLIGACIYCRNC
ncbi:hypothetical protein ACF0H5_008783 [Mactra antiquata]